ncbi:hypothetical protein F7R06_24840 [Pseudomonas moorei]|nr:hypothetical protein F7R06_24840 [Pseudomonas moorei]
MWRGSLLPLDCAAVVNLVNVMCLNKCGVWVGAASQPSGSKLPRHKKPLSSHQLPTKPDATPSTACRSP